MESSQIIQLAIYSVIAGVLYFLIASGLSLVFGIMRIVNFAHGQFYMLGAVIVYYLFQVYHVNFILTVLIATVGMGLLGAIVERFLFRPLRGDDFPVTMVGLGLVLLVPAITLTFLGGRDKGVQPPYPAIVNVFGTSIGLDRIVIFGVGLAFLAGLFLFIKYHRLGIAMRAVAQDPGAATLCGIGTDSTHSWCMAIGCALAGTAGALAAPLYFINPSIGNGAVFTAFIVVILGGLGSIPGALIGGLLLGFANTFGLRYLGAFTDMIVFGIAILVLLIKPTGLLGDDS